MANKNTFKKGVAFATGGPMGYMQMEANIKQEKAAKKAQKEQDAALKERKSRASAERRELIDQTRSQMGLGGDDYSISRTGGKSNVKTLTGQLG